MYGARACAQKIKRSRVTMLAGRDAIFRFNCILSRAPFQLPMIVSVSCAKEFDQLNFFFYESQAKLTNHITASVERKCDSLLLFVSHRARCRR